MAELELEEDQHWRRHEWRFQRFGWALVTVAFIAAAVGGWGYGPVSHAVESNRDLEVEYTRIVHREAADDLEIRGRGQTVQLLGDWFDAVQIEQITPEPESMSADASGLTLEYAEDEVNLSVSFRARHVGPLTGSVVVGKDAVDVWQVVLP